MNLTLWTFVLCLAAPLAEAGNSAPCEKLPREYEISAPMKAADVEAEWLKDLPEMTKVRPDMPQVPFGFVNDEWKRFKAKIKDGDVLVRFISDQQSWTNLAGREGLALIRLGCIVNTFTFSMN